MLQEGNPNNEDWREKIIIHRVSAHTITSWLKSCLTSSRPGNLEGRSFIFPYAIGNTALQVKPVVIEGRVWIGSRVIILKGVTIGHDSIIGAGSVVTKSVPPLSVIVGPAAHIIKNLQPEATEAELHGKKYL